MDYLNFVVLNDAYTKRITRDDIEIVEYGRAFENVIDPIRRGTVATVKRSTGYTATGEISGKRAVITIYDEGAQIAAIGICLHSRASKSAWGELHQGGELPDLIPPSVPWVAVRYDVAEIALPPWLDMLAWHVGWYLLDENPEK